MPSASVFFYGRRSRSSRTFDDSSSPSSPSPPSHHHHHHRHRTSADLHRRRHHHHSPAVAPDDADHLPPPPSLLLRPPSFRSPSLQENDLHQREYSGGSSSGDINNRAVVSNLSRRFSNNNRLPGPVLLAKERLLQRLRSVSVSGARQRRETPPSFNCNEFWVVDADWETSGFREPETANSSWSEYPSEVHQESTLEEPKKKPLGLSKETLLKLHHEVFIEQQNTSSSKSTECSICLENFVEGNELVSLPCGHRFHTLCLSPWLKTCGDCPYCRSCIMLSA